MERNTFNILFYISKNKLIKDGKAPLLMRITINGRRWDSALKVGIYPDKWYQKRERANKDIRYQIFINITG